ncbi:glycosyltransferase [Aquihabitans sp. McL0605]|uniref:glycosyltransferase n=1 Tax=Aquihabitans sp. McL0605 TaxID=3415671 RepID=UPI003CF0B5F8
MEELFWVSVAVLVQTYVAFPLVTIVRGRLFGRDVLVGDITPSISVVIAAHDEATSIGPKLHSVLDADYPVDLVEVIVASDGSADGTPEAAAIDPRVRVLVLPRVGKAAALNAAITASRQDVLVFTDANSRFAPDALRKIVRPLADPEVGGVAGDQRYEPPAAAASGLPGSGTVDGERRYWDFDRILKEAESAGGNVIGATGALYAVRRELVGTVPEGVTDDFTTSTGVIEQGHRLVFAGDATVFEPVAASTDAEFRRKVRVMTRGLAAVAYRRRLLDPREQGFYAYQLINHKVLRRLMGIPLLTALAASAACSRRRPIYRVALAGQLAVYVPGALALAHPSGRIGRSRLGGLAGYFCMVNGAGLVAAWNIVSGRRIVHWEPERTDGDVTIDLTDRALGAEGGSETATGTGTAADADTEVPR